MVTFLHQVADYLLKNQSEDLADLEVVLPTRRSVFFLKQELANLATIPVFSPVIQAIDDFVANLSPFETADPVSLILELYESFNTIDSSLSFERYMRWASVLLSDFDRIDQYCVATAPLFEYMTEARSLERWKEELPEGRELIMTSGSKPFFLLFEKIQQVYHLFRERLTEQKKAYRGMMYRHLAENMGSIIPDGSKTKRYIFVGFNAFSESEKMIISHLVEAGKAELLWDTDEYYMEANKNIEGGKYLREYRYQKVFGEEWKWTGDSLLKGEKKITVYGVPNATLQTKVAGRIYAEMTQADAPGTEVPTAILLSDENLLTPMLYSLEKEVEDLNVTMGLPLKGSLLFTLVDSIFELQRNTIENQQITGVQYNHQFITRVINHPFIRQYEVSKLERDNRGLTGLQRLQKEIVTNNRVFLSSDELFKIGNHHPLFINLFTRWDKNDSTQAIRSFYDLIDLLREVYRENKQAIETEYLYLFYTLLKQFEISLEKKQEKITLSTLRTFLYELIRQVKIPFSGEPVSNLQLLGILETRALDFDRMILLSVNEGVLPPPRRLNSLIPADIAAEAGLPTYQNQEAIISYHFYRMLQRAREVHILYVDTTDDSGGGEKSRYLLQLEMELRRYNPGIQIEQKGVTFQNRVMEPLGSEIVKDQKIIDAIKLHLATKGLYPTDLNRLIGSSLDFYLTCVLGIKELKQTDEELGMDKLGTWLHKVFEILDLAYFKKGQDPTVEEIKTVLKNEFEDQFHGYVTDSGLNSVYYRVGEQQALAFFKSQLHKSPRHRVLAAEQHLRFEIQLHIKDEVVPVKLGGKIDRVELAPDGRLYIMDYKTGKVELKGKKELNDEVLQSEILLKDTNYTTGYVRQLWLYQYLILRAMAQDGGWKLDDDVFAIASNPISAGFYSLRSPDKLFENPLQFSDDNSPVYYIKKTEELLSRIVEDLLDPAIPLQ